MRQTAFGAELMPGVLSFSFPPEEYHSVISTQVTDLGKLNIVESCTEGHDMSQNWLAIVSALADYTLNTLGSHTHDGRCGERCSDQYREMHPMSTNNSLFHY